MIPTTVNKDILDGFIKELSIARQDPLSVGQEDAVRDAINLWQGKLEAYIIPQLDAIQVDLKDILHEINKGAKNA